MSEEKKVVRITIAQRKAFQTQAHDTVMRRLVEAQKQEKLHRIEATKRLAHEFGADQMMERVYAKTEEINARDAKRDLMVLPYEKHIESLREQIEIQRNAIDEIDQARTDDIRPLEYERAKLHEPVKEIGFYIDSQWKNAPWDPKSVCLKEGQIGPQQFDITHCSDAGQALRGLLSGDTDRMNELKNAVPEIDVICWHAETTEDVLAQLRAIGVDLTD